MSSALHKSRGMSLVELMIVVTIVGILVAIALPSYRNYVLKSGRQEGMDLLISGQQKVESYLARFNKGSATLMADVCGSTTKTNSNGNPGYVCGGDGNYVLANYTASVIYDTDAALNASYALTKSYTLIAYPVGPQVKDGDLLLNYNPKTRQFIRSHRTPPSAGLPNGSIMSDWDFQPGK